MTLESTCREDRSVHGDFEERVPPPWLLQNPDCEASGEALRSWRRQTSKVSNVSSLWRARMEHSCRDLEGGSGGWPSAEAFGPTALTFKDISFSVKTAGGGKEKSILEPMSGHFDSGNLVAIMGPSGSGKSTLLDILADKKTASYSGTVHVNGRPRDRLFRRLSAYIPQDDIMPAHLTVEEAVRFNLDLKTISPAKVTAKMQKEWVQRRLEVLGLDGVKDSYIGGPALRGISGGQRRRLSLARGLAAGAHIIFCDEPTSGLSSSDAESVIKYMSHVAHYYNVLIFVVIHQPRIEVAEMFDKLLLLTSNPGRVVYNGEMIDAPGYFEKAGFPVPIHANPADHFMDLITPGLRGSEVETFLDHYAQHGQAVVDLEVSRNSSERLMTAMQLLERERSQKLKWGELPPVRNSVYAVSFGRQLQVVFQRQLCLRLRDKSSILADLIAAVAKAFIVGFVYMRTSELGAQMQVAYFFMLCMTTAIDGIKHMPAVTGERTVVKLETSEALYSEWAYIISFSTISFVQGLVGHSLFLVILHALSGFSWQLFPSIYVWSTLLSVTMDALYLMVAAIAKDASNAIVFSLPFMMLFLLFNGFTSTRESVLPQIAWAIEVSPVAYAIQQITFAASRLEENANMAEGFAYVIKSSGYEDQPGTALFDICAWFAVFKIVQPLCFRMLNNIAR